MSRSEPDLDLVGVLHRLAMPACHREHRDGVRGALAPWPRDPSVEFVDGARGPVAFVDEPTGGEGR
jgi:hypothetical protein